jgi:hypothetical protein
MIRPTIVKGIRVQHIAGQSLDLEKISNPSFVPPIFDTSYHFKGMSKPKGQEKYDPDDFIELHDAPTFPIMQLAEPLLTVGAPVEYRGTEPPPVPVKTEFQMEGLGIDANYSYDVELPQKAQHEQVSNPYDPLISYPVCDSEIPSNGYFTQPGTIFPHPIATRHHTDANQSSHQYQENYAVALTHLPPPPQTFTVPHVQQEYWIPSHPSLAFHHAPWSTSPPSFDVPPKGNFFDEMMSLMYAWHISQANFHDQAHYPALVAY